MMGTKIFEKIRKEDVGAIGIGAMIVFIAMVLVAGIAASVLIQTSSNLQMQALSTGQETIAEVASGLKVEGISGHNSSGLIDKLAIEITPLAGAPDIDLSQGVVEISDSDGKYILRYGDALTNISSVNGSIFDVSDFGDATTFDIIVLQDADESCLVATPVINYGDHVILAINTTLAFNSSLPPRQDVFGLVIPEEGSFGVIGFTVPPAVTEAVVSLQ
ncbi:MAG: hypothetical protein JSW06_11240 [Thermoplasmatales archaeon]|nr:MAG: hypothetical protein JSW06_11240 [Thermoplasmatales archaeon]